MPAQLSVSPIEVASNAGTPATPAPKLSVVPQNGYTHVIASGESLYAIARKYNVTTDSIVLANGLSSPDKIFVGQKLTIPGAPEMPANANASKAAVDRVTTGAISQKTSAPKVIQPVTTNTQPQPTAVAATKPAEVKQVAAAQPGTGKFRWPASGKVVTDFAASKGTGINIEVPEGTAIRAAETGTVIYVGSAVEGYGNLILVKHDNGFVSAYAHLSQITVSKGDAVMRGDAIGLAGMTGSVSRPQLHFELRKGATPVDPVPLLAS